MNWKKYLSIIGILLFIYILIKINIFEVFNEIRNANVIFLIIALFIAFLGIFINTFKWYILAVFQGIKVPFSESVKINLISNFYGFVTPSKLGTVVRIEYLKKYTGNIGKGLSNYILDKVLDISSIIFIAIVFSFIFRDQMILPLGVLTMIFLILVLFTLLFIDKTRSKSILKLLFSRIVSEKMKNKVRITFDSFYEDIPRKRYFVLFFAINVVNWAFSYLIYYFVGLSLGIDLPFIYYLAIMPIGTLVSMIPISINGLGTQEITLISLFGLFGIEATKIFSMSLISLVFVILISCLAIFFIFKKNKQDNSS
jgi:glycosyltransferase 2 family protein